MIAVRHSRQGRALAVVSISAALFLAACGGSSGGSSKASSTSPDTNAVTTTTASNDSSGGNGDCFTKAGTQKARVRFVNLYTNSTYKASDIDVYQGYSGTDPCAKKLATVAFGHASDYIDVTASDESGNWSAAAYVAGSTDKDHQIITQSETWKGGEQVTITFEGAEPGPGLPPSAGGDQAFFEVSTSGDASLPAVPGKGVIGIAATSLQYVVKDGAWVAGAVGQSGCLHADGDSGGITTNIGGTQLVPYTVAPGTLQVALFPSIPGKCTGTPDIGPAAVDATTGSRTFVFAYGSDPQQLKLLVLPVAS